jgi:hypothetical protein
VAGEIDPVRVVDETIEDGVGKVGLPINSCHLSTGIWLVMIVDRRP